MEKDIYQYLQNNENENIIVKKRNVIPYLLATLGSVAVVGMAISPLIADKYTSMMLILLGLVAMCLSIAMWVFMVNNNRYKYLYGPSNEVLKKNFLYLSSSDAQSFQSVVRTGNASMLAAMKPENYSGHYLNILGVAQGNFYLIQLMEYIPHEYQPVSEVLVAEGSIADAVTKLLAKKK